MGQGSGDGVTRAAFAAAASTPLIRFDDSTRQHCTVRLEALADHDEAELVESAELGQVRADEVASGMSRSSRW